MLISQTKNPESGFNFSNATAFQAFSDDPINSTTSGTYQTKLSGSSGTDDQANYIMQWYCELANSTNNGTTLFRAQWKNTSSGTWINLTEIDSYIGRSSVYVPVNGFKIITNTITDTIDFRLQYAVGSGGTASIKNANFYLFEVLPT